MNEPSNTQTPQAPALHLRLILPSAQIALGAYSIDPVEQLLGRSLAELLAPLMVQPMSMARGPDGRLVELYPLTFEDGAGFSLRLGAFGEAGLYAEQGLLQLLLPWGAHTLVEQRLAGLIVHGPVRSTGGQGVPATATFWLRLERGMTFHLPLPGFGEVGLEVG